jgi:hypothetical protein
MSEGKGRFVGPAGTCLLVVGLVLGGCGGGAEQARETSAPPPPAPVVEEAPAPPELEHVYYQVFWEQIHVLTVYRGGGRLRSEEPNHPDAVLGGSCSYMSAASHYFEHEPELAALIAQADDLDGFFALLAQDPAYEVREAYLEEGY